MQVVRDDQPIQIRARSQFPHDSWSLYEYPIES